MKCLNSYGYSSVKLPSMRGIDFIHVLDRLEVENIARQENTHTQKRIRPKIQMRCSPSTHLVILRIPFPLHRVLALEGGFYISLSFIVLSFLKDCIYSLCYLFHIFLFLSSSRLSCCTESYTRRICWWSCVKWYCVFIYNYPHLL